MRLLPEKGLAMLMANFFGVNGFRCIHGAMDLAMIRSLLSTARQRGWDIIQTLNANTQSLISDLRVG